MRESPVSPQDNKVRHASPRRRWWRWLWAPALAILLACWILEQQARQYQLVASFPVQDNLLIPARSGFLVLDSHLTYTLHDWAGSKRWSVTPPAAQYLRPGRRWRPGIGSGYSLSPDGHLFAGATVQGRQIRVQTWHDGKPAGDVIFPAAGTVLGAPYVRVLNSARIFCWYTTQPPATKSTIPAVAIEGDKIIARGEFFPNAIVAPDGFSVVGQTGGTPKYARIEIANGLLALRDRHALQDDLRGFTFADGFQMDSTIFAKGAVLAFNGALYQHGTRTGLPSYWHHIGMSSGGEYTLQASGNRVRVFSPPTGKAWAFSVPGTVNGGDITPDGKYALVWLQRDPSAPLVRYLKELPFMARFTGDLSGEHLALYRYPGRRFATWRSHMTAWWPGTSESEMIERWWFPSPDGRTIAMTVSTMKGTRCFVFRHGIGRRAMQDGP